MVKYLCALHFDTHQKGLVSTYVQKDAFEKSINIYTSPSIHRPGVEGRIFFFLFSFLKICFCCGFFFLSGAEKKTSGEDTKEEEVEDEGEKKRKVV